MWSAQEIARVLREDQETILHNWRAEAQTQLWHLDKELFSGKEKAAVACATATLAALCEYHHHAAATDAEASTSETGFAQNSSLLRPTETASPAQREGTPPATGHSESEIRLFDCAPRWTALPMAWTDLRSLLGLLISGIQQALTRYHADEETLAHEDRLLHEFLDTVANLRIQDLEQEMATHREETILTQHLAGRFLANASHEIRTPLTAVLGFAELLLEETYGAVTEEQRIAIGHIENSAQNLLEIVNNLLDLLHIRAGKLTLQYRPVDIGLLLRNLYDILYPLAKRKNVHFHLELPGEPGVIEADENIVRHIVYHLLASGLRATPHGGTVTLSAERQGENLVIITKDTALHLPPEAVANMLDPFPRLENSPARGYEGWEVGLPLVRRYVELHGGELNMTSLPGQGTLFRILLPVVRTKKTISDDGELIKTGK